MRGPQRSRPRAVLTVLFTDIVSSTEVALRLGDRAWADLLSRYRATVRTALRRHRGRELDTAGDGFFAAFQRPTDALACATEIVRGASALDLEVRTGIHAGEVETLEGKAGGITVHVAARLMASAGPGEIVTSATIRDLAAGGGWVFVSLGPLSLKGLPEPIPAFRLDPASGSPELDDGGPRRIRAALRPSRPVRAGAALLAVAVIVVAGVLSLPRLAGGSPRASPSSGASGEGGRATPVVSSSAAVSPAPASGSAGSLTWSLVEPAGLSGGEIAGIGGVGSDGCCLVVGASGGRAAVWGSADGRTFSPAKAPPERDASVADAELNGDVLGQPVFVAVGSDCGAGPDRCIAAAWWTTDPDAGPWMRATFDVMPGAPSQITGLGIGGPGYVAVGTVSDGARPIGAVWTSVDGRRWIRTDAPGKGPGVGVRDVASGGSLVVAVGGDLGTAAVWTSTDGRTWSAVPNLDLGRTAFDSVTWAGDRFLAAGNGSSGPALWSSTDGRSWRPVAGLPHLAFVSLRGIAVTPPHVFAIGQDGDTIAILSGCCIR